MSGRFESLEKDLDALIFRGELLYYSMVHALARLGKEYVKVFKEKGIPLPDFPSEYDTWYSESLRVIQQLIPERIEDFIKQYKYERRKQIDYATYGISDYLIGLRTTRGAGHVVVDSDAAIPRMQNQVSILKSAKARFRSQLFDIQEVLQADIFDSELDAAKDLAKKGYTRGAGAIAGVILEAHLAHVGSLHQLKLRKQNPTINDWNQLLKDNDIVDTPRWRFIQHLADLRNPCDHKKAKEPTKEEIEELVAGVDKVIKTVF